MSSGFNLSAPVMLLMTLQGLPAAITPSGISFVTILPAQITEPAPMVTPPQITALAPIRTGEVSNITQL